MPSGLGAALEALLSSRDEVDTSSGPVGPLLCTSDPVSLRRSLQRLSKDFVLDAREVLSRTLALLPAGVGVGLLSAPVGSVVTIYRSMVAGENEPGGKGKLEIALILDADFGVPVNGAAHSIGEQANTHPARFESLRGRAAMHCMWAEEPHVPVGEFDRKL